MTYLGEEAVTMRKLRQLLLRHMSLQDLSEQAFSKAPFLSHVDLSLNQLRYMEPLSGPEKLDILNLTGTKMLPLTHNKSAKKFLINIASLLKRTLCKKNKKWFSQMQQ